MSLAIMSATILDAKTAQNARERNRQTVSVKVPYTSESLATLTLWYNAFITAVDENSDGQVVAGSMTLEISLPSGLKTDPVAGSDVQEGGLFVFSLDGLTNTFGVRIPAIAQASLAANGLDIDPTVTEVQHFYNLLTGADGSPIDFPASNDSAIDLSAFLRGRKSTRK